MQSLRAKITLAAICFLLVTTISIMFFVQRETETAIRTASNNHALNLVNTVGLNVENAYKSLLFHRSALIDRRKTELRNTISLVTSYIEVCYQKAQKGLVTQEEARRTAIEHIQHIRYNDGVGYVWINDMGYPIPGMIMHPTIPELNGQVLDDAKFNCALGKKQNLFQAMVEVCAASEEGFVDYLWPKPTKDGLTAEQPKLSFVRLFKPWNWVVGTGVYIDDIEQDTQKRLDAILVELEQTFSKVTVAESGYMYLFNGQQEMLIHPSQKGADFSTLLNPVTQNPMLEDLIAASDRPGQFLDYKWNKPQDHQDQFVFRKRSYVTYFAPLDWYIAASIYFDEIEAPVRALRTNILYISLPYLAIALVLSLLLSKSLTRPLRKLTLAAKQIERDGIESASIPIMGTIETRELGKILDNMIHSIKMGVSEKEDLLEALGTSNHELTLANHNLQKEIKIRQQAEKVVRSALKEKEVLLREVHHRVKNNLSVIISLLSLQSNTFADDRVKIALTESRNRIRSMALIHETLYRSENIADIHLKDYVVKLVNAVRDAMMGKASQVTIDIRTDDIKLTVDQAVACGLILNELVTNALKYAFPSNNGGAIAIIARYTVDDTWIELKVMDDGIGLPEDLDHRRANTLGMRIISLLIENQLEGQCKMRNADGAHFLIRWPLA